MSPNELVSRAKRLGLDWIAITDHNSMANCPAYEAVALKSGLAFSWGVEVQSSEEIHLLVYFDDHDAAKAFDEELYASLLPIENDPDFFGDQVIIDENEAIIRLENRALINSSMWDINEVCEHAQSHSGWVVPAHVDATANSILSQLGFMPEEPVFEAFGISARLDESKFLSRQPWFRGKSLLRCSDAHYLADLGSGYSTVLCHQPSIAELRLAALAQDGRKIEI